MNAPACKCLTLTGEHDRDWFTADRPHDASALALLSTALAPAEGPDNLALGVLHQLSVELDCLSENEHLEKSMRLVLYALSERARVAYEVISRLEGLPAAEQPAPVTVDQRITKSGDRVRKPKGRWRG